MTEPNSPPICPCGFYGSPQTLGLCSKCFREREQNRNQATADITRPSPSSSNTDQSRVSMPTNSNLVIDTSDSFLRTQAPPDGMAPTAGSSNVSADTHAHSAESSSTSSADDTPLPSTGECCDKEANERHGKKRKRSDEGSDDVEDRGPAKRERTAHSSKYCRMCRCRLELAVREIGKCKCGFVFCLLHRLPEQHNCTFDHKEDGRREARAKMVPARKHVGTTLKRLDSDC